MTKNKNKRKFIIKHMYPGGNKALQIHIQKNLKYPKEAIRKKTEGEVIVKFKINPIGQVFQPEIIKGISTECNKEALRLVKTLKYPRHTNRNIKVTTNKKVKIKFKLPPPIIINYEIKK